MDNCILSHIPLYTAIQNNHIDCLTILIKVGGADSNIRNKFGDTLLHYATYKDKINFVIKLIEAGADPNTKNKMGETPLHYAMDKDKINCAIKLIEAGADLYVKNEFNETPLHYASRNHQDYIEKLIKAGAKRS